MRHWSAFVFCSSVLAACAQQPVCEPTRTLYVVNHGWHSGIVVERAELARRLPALEAGDAEYLEVGWGEERFYQARESTLGMALRALLKPNASVLHVVPFSGTPQRYFIHSEVREVRTDDARYASALDFIAASFTKEPARLGPSLYGEGWFYPATRSFHLFNTCNSWVADVLEKASCR